METNATKENIAKYYLMLKELKIILEVTERVSMLKFSTNRELSKNFSTALQNLNIIKLKKRGVTSLWEWIGDEPSENMAILVLKELSRLNPPRKLKPQKELFVQEVEYYECSFLFGLINLKFKPHFKN